MKTNDLKKATEYYLGINGLPQLPTIKKVILAKPE